MDEDLEQLCEEIQEPPKKISMCFNAKDFKTCLSIFDQKCQSSLVSVLYHKAVAHQSTSYCYVMPKQNSLGTRKQIQKCNKKM